MGVAQRSNVTTGGVGTLPLGRPHDSLLQFHAVHARHPVVGLVPDTSNGAVAAAMQARQGTGPGMAAHTHKHFAQTKWPHGHGATIGRRSLVLKSQPLTAHFRPSGAGRTGGAGVAVESSVSEPSADVPAPAPAVPPPPASPPPHAALSLAAFCEPRARARQGESVPEGWGREIENTPTRAMPQTSLTKPQLLHPHTTGMHLREHG